MLTKILHIEPTDVCPLACPLCSRETDANFNKSIKNHLTVDRVMENLSVDTIRSLDKMFMCGVYGDPAAGKHTMEIYNHFRYLNPTITLGMNTSGSLQSKQWFHTLGKMFNLLYDYVVFSIDGLEDTNHIYRKNSNWNKIIENAQAFIDAGGSAHWDMLVYKHNQHQVDQCEQLARDMGFTWFRAKVSKRAYINGLEFPDGWVNSKQATGKIKCMALEEKSMYMDANGRISPCCWFGGKNNTVTSIEQVSSTWDTNPHPTCQSICSGSNNSFKNQWRREVELTGK